MKVRFQADADFNHIIIKAVLRREPTIDFQTAESANIVGLDDLEVLAIASKAGRVLLTHDRKTMPKHFGEFIMSETSSGVIVVPQRTAVRAKVVEDLILIWTASERVGEQNTIAAALAVVLDVLPLPVIPNLCNRRNLRTRVS